MATYSGRNARVTVNASTTEAIVAELSDWKITMSASEIDTTSFGDSWGKSDVGMKNWTGSVSGFFDSSDTTGQDVLRAAFEAGTLLADMRFYITYSETSSETIVYVAADTATDANAGLRISSLDIGQDKGGVATLSMNFTGSGPVTDFTETVS